MAMIEKINFGDIVTVEDYDGYYFRVTGRQTQIFEYENEPTETEYMLDLTCAHTERLVLAYIEDVTLVATKDEADAFLADKPAPEKYGGGISVMFAPWFGGEDDNRITVNIPLTPKSRATLAAIREARIDVLLDEWTDNATKARAVGDEDGFYAARIGEIEAEIIAIKDGD
ncbi:hypothetical protein [Sporosarcina sp. ITBMC105]